MASFSYNNDDQPGLARRYVPGSAGMHGMDLNDTIRDYNEADRRANDAQYAPSNTIASRFNPLDQGSVFRIQNPTGWEALNQKYNGGTNLASGTYGYDPEMARRIHDEAMAPSQPIEDYAAMHGYGPGYQVAMKRYLGQDDGHEQQGMARAPRVGTPITSGGGIGQPAPIAAPSAPMVPPSPTITTPTPKFGLSDVINRILGIGG